MISFLIRRVVFGLFTLWVVITLVFILYFVAPHDVAGTLAGRAATPALRASLTHSLGLDQPIWVQYGGYLSRLIHFDFGQSFVNHVPVRTLLGQAVPIDISLAVGAAIIWTVMGIGIGVLAARRPRSILDRGATFFVLTGISMPTFVLGLLLIYVFFFVFTTHGITLFPQPGTWVPFHQNPLLWARALILPWFTLALITAATYSRLTRSALLDTLGEDYVRTARAKGLSERRVVYRHALRSALTPIVTQFGIDFATILGGAIVTETVFGLPGLGRLVVQSIGFQDLPTVEGIVIVAAAFIVLANIAVDALYAVLDPRVRLA